MVSQWIRLIGCNYFEITMPMITLDSRIVCVFDNSTPNCQTGHVIDANMSLCHFAHGTEAVDSW